MHGGPPGWPPASAAPPLPPSLPPPPSPSPALPMPPPPTAVQLLKETETAGGGGPGGAKPKRPRALVLGPTRELTDQILQVAKALAHTAKFRSGIANGGTDMGSQKGQLERPLDVLVGTPQRVMQHAGV